MSSRETILGSIRSHLAASVPFDRFEPQQHDEPEIRVPAEASPLTVVEIFKQSLEAVDGHCVVVQTEEEVALEVIRILKDYGKRIAISDAPVLSRLIRVPDLEIAPNASDIFEFDAGISTVQAAIAETGTLVLDSARERHRFVSLVPPVHIAIVDAQTIFQTLGEALAFVHQNNDVSPAVTFITGPSRTADIELTLAIGVHGPQELYVIINEGPALTR
jgi:L-lactate dehydrogenase complex protein LldG